MNEKQFIIQFALHRFNRQYNRKLKLQDFDAKSITPNRHSQLAYEIFSVRLDDYVRLRMYLSYHRYDQIGPYRLEVDGSLGTGVLGDEVYVCQGTIDRFYIESGTYKFAVLEEDITLWNLTLSEDGDGLITEGGDYILLEGQN